jgi:hypothetical protein
MADREDPVSNGPWDSEAEIASEGFAILDEFEDDEIDDHPLDSTTEFIQFRLPEDAAEFLGSFYPSSPTQQNTTRFSVQQEKEKEEQDYWENDSDFTSSLRGRNSMHWASSSLTNATLGSSHKLSDSDWSEFLGGGDDPFTPPGSPHWPSGTWVSMVKTMQWLIGIRTIISRSRVRRSRLGQRPPLLVLHRYFGPGTRTLSRRENGLSLLDWSH